MNLNSSGIKEAYEAYSKLKKALKEDQLEVDGMVNKTIPKARAYDLSVRSDEAHCEYYANKLNELIDQKSYSWYYEVKSCTFLKRSLRGSSYNISWGSGNDKTVSKTADRKSNQRRIYL